MRWGLSINVPATYKSNLWGLPPPSQIEAWQRRDGTQMVNLLYHFLYPPQNCKEWQRVAGIKVQIKNMFNDIEFTDYESCAVDGKVYTVSELGKYFREFVKFPKPLFPGKRESYRMLCIHAKRLHYENKLHVEQLIATSMRFNTVDPEGIGQTIKRALAAYKFALDHCEEWPTKLSEDELEEAHKKGAAKTHQIRRDKANEKKQRAITLRNEGKTLSVISSLLGVSLRTVSNYLK